MKNKFTRGRKSLIQGFTLIELSIVMVIIAIAMSGFMRLATVAAASRQNSDLFSAIESAKFQIILESANQRTVELMCVSSGSSCPVSADCAASDPCATYVTSYNLPADRTIGEDPWGRPLEYAGFGSPVVPPINPDTVVFTLTSGGEDVALAEDDFQASVTAGEMLSLIAKMGLGG